MDRSMIKNRYGLKRSSNATIVYRRSTFKIIDDFGNAYKVMYGDLMRAGARATGGVETGAGKGELGEIRMAHQAAQQQHSARTCRQRR